ncbi:MAG: DUF4198 domain-containing protein [Gammaproteobacteria bacterium]
MPIKTAVRIITLSLSLLAASVAYSHDIWLFPERFTLSKGDILIVRQLAGSELDIEVELALLRRMTPRFELITPSGSVDLLSKLPDERTRPEIKPVLERKLDFDGLALLTMEHAFVHTEFSSEKFLEYLQHEEFRMEKFQDRIGRRLKERERYARTIKCLVGVGKVTEGDLHRRIVGQKLEILLLQNPYLLNPGDYLEVQVLFDAEPLPDQLVTAFHGDGERLVSTSKARTNADGIARFNLDRGGFWLIRLVHLLPCSEGSNADCDYVDWESYWASYSFELD